MLSFQSRIRPRIQSEVWTPQIFQLSRLFVYAFWRIWWIAYVRFITPTGAYCWTGNRNRCTFWILDNVTNSENLSKRTSQSKIYLANSVKVSQESESMKLKNLGSFSSAVTPKPDLTEDSTSRLGPTDLQIVPVFRKKRKSRQIDCCYKLIATIWR